MSEPARVPYQYTVIRVTPRIERGECFNAGIVLLCRPRRFLRARVLRDAQRLAALAPNLPADLLRQYLEAIVRIADGEHDAGPIARLSRAERFHWLAAPASTVIQPSPVHTGLCHDPAATLDRLFASLIAPPAGAST